MIMRTRFDPCERERTNQCRVACYQQPFRITGMPSPINWPLLLLHPEASKHGFTMKTLMLTKLGCCSGSLHPEATWIGTSRFKAFMTRNVSKDESVISSESMPMDNKLLSWWCLPLLEADLFVFAAAHPSHQPPNALATAEHGFVAPSQHAAKLYWPPCST